MPETGLEEKKAKARAWFESLQDEIIGRFEALEREALPPLYRGDPGSFEKTPWTRGDGSEPHEWGVPDQVGDVLDETHTTIVPHPVGTAVLRPPPDTRRRCTVAAERTRRGTKSVRDAAHGPGSSTLRAWDDYASPSRDHHPTDGHIGRVTRTTCAPPGARTVRAHRRSRPDLRSPAPCTS